MILEAAKIFIGTDWIILEADRSAIASDSAFIEIAKPFIDSVHGIMGTIRLFIGVDLILLETFESSTGSNRLLSEEYGTRKDHSPRAPLPTTPLFGSLATARA